MTSSAVMPVLHSSVSGGAARHGSSSSLVPSEAAMNYKFSCPSCGRRTSRWHIFLEPVIYHRCRGCGARFRTTLSGWLATCAVVALQVAYFILARRRVIAPYQAIALVVGICGLAIWLLPYFTPARLQLRSGSRDNNNPLD